MLEFFPVREIIVDFFGWQVRWYGLMYVLAFWLAFFWLPRLARYRNINLFREQWAYIVTLGAGGALFGGRLGYVLFYNFAFFWAHPGQIFNLSAGGMSSHGGFIGVALALWYASKKLKINILALADVVVVPVAFGLALGRIGNFINQELYVGQWALYVAISDAMIGLICFLLVKGNKIVENNELKITGDAAGVPHRAPAGYSRSRRMGEQTRQDPFNNHYFSGFYKNGDVLAIFLLLYGVIRFLNELVRIQEWPLVFGLTRGQLLTVPILLFGIYVLTLSKRQYP